ncbi:hypothetical protein EYF80_018909 [Liparis tanakae]|uniref:Uncharacterized protein n=1 Tax=Liparis tanakae TaxID=230148 RepID=A0A4Z2I0X0_9TELE|nr:hypothetical protein EYF80_018909 [Liparis tanakae]
MGGQVSEQQEDLPIKQRHTPSPCHVNREGLGLLLGFNPFAPVAFHNLILSAPLLHLHNSPPIHLNSSPAFPSSSPQSFCNTQRREGARVNRESPKGAAVEWNGRQVT